MYIIDYYCLLYIRLYYIILDYIILDYIILLYIIFVKLPSYCDSNKLREIVSDVPSDLPRFLGFRAFLDRSLEPKFPNIKRFPIFSNIYYYTYIYIYII